MFLFKNIKAQEFAPKTIRIINYDSSDLVKKSDTLAFIPPYIFSGLTKNYDVISSKSKIYYDDSITTYDDNKNRQIEDYYRRCCYFWYRYSFDHSPKFDTSHFYNPAHFDDSELSIPVASNNNSSRLYVPIISDKDYEAIKMQLNKIENIFNDSTVANLKINDTLFGLLSKYSSSLCFLTDIKEAWYVGKGLFGGSAKMANCLYRVVVVDMKNKNIRYYNSFIEAYSYGPEYFRTMSSGVEKKHPNSYMRLKPVKYIISAMIRVRKKKA